MAIIFKDIITWLKGWFYTKDEVNSRLNTRYITEDYPLPNLETTANANQHEINLAIDEKITATLDGVSLACISDFVINTSDLDDVELELTACTGKVITQVAKTGTSGLVDTYTIYYNDNTTDTFTVTNGSDASVDIVTSWSSTTSDSKVASEKLVKDSLDTKQPTLVSGTSIKTVNNQSLLGSGNIDVQGSNVDIVTSWSSTTSNSKVPSEKLTKTSLDNKANISHTHTQNDITDLPSLSTVAHTGDYDDLLNSPTIPSKTSDLRNDSNFISTSNTQGLLKNDGSVDTTQYSTFTGNYNDLSNKPTVPTPSTTIPFSDSTNGTYGSGTSYARSNHSHPKSNLYAESGHTHSDYANKVHTHTTVDITDLDLSPVATSGSYNDLYNKPSIPSSSSDLSDGSDLVKTSDTVGLLKNDGDVDTTIYQTVENKVNSWSSTPSYWRYPTEKLVKDDLDKKINKSIVQGLVKNDGTIDTTQYLSQHQDISGKEDVSHKVTSWHHTPNDYSYPSEKLVKDSLDGKADTSHSHTTSDITNFPSLSTVATSGSYTDLSNKPSIPSKTSDLTNDSNFISTSSTSGLIKNDGSIDTSTYLTSASLSSYQTTANLVTSFSSTTSDSKYPSEKLTKDSLDRKQAKLSSGSNIKTINHNSILGSGNLNIGGGYNTVYFDACNNSTKLSNYNKTGRANLTKEHTGDTHYYVKLTSNNTATWTVNNITVSNKARITAEWYMGSNTTIDPKLLIYDPTLQNGYSAEINKNLSRILIGTHTLSSFGSMIATESQETSSATWYKLEFIIDRELLTFNLYDANGVLLGSVDGVGSLNLSESGNLVGFGLEYSMGGDAYIRNIKVEDWDANSVNVDIVTSWSSILSDESVPSEKLVKNSLDGKADTSHSHTTSDISNFPSLSTVATSGSYADLSNKPTIPSSSSDLSDGSDLIKKSNTTGLVKNDGGIDTSTYLTSSSLSGYQTTNNLVTSFSSTTSDSKYPSEKLTKTSLDNKVDKVTGKGLSSNDFTNSYKSTMDSLKTVATTGSYNDLTDKPTIPSAITVDSALSSTSTNPVQNKVINTALGNKANSTHTHTKSQITDFPTIPTKTSDLTNDGADGTNVFVSNNDSRLSDSRTPTSHSHGNLSNDGKISTTSSATMLYFTGVGASANTLYKSNKLSSDVLIDGTAHSNIGTSANASQSTINSAIDTLIGQAISYINQ